MAHVFDITIEASLKDSDLINRLGRFTEDVYRECRDSGATLFGYLRVEPHARAVQRHRSFETRSRPL